MTVTTAYILWDRYEQRVVGGSSPMVFPSSGAATTYAATLRTGSDQHPKPTTLTKQFDAVAVTVP